ncbi:hypothetical protein TD95_003700 [Thielaviopsis punctulata]|uniref:Cytochrome c oxidase assembly protein n=1 Tax=Thielaviopsis punctulata TaxID=72032 RepID=A0A0F4ZD07_9PEZI|nr:hypothetical protein TD95_003700 [Thielaviopsis punctulata]
MSQASRFAIGFSSVFATATVLLVHFQQQAEKTAMHQGVVRDMEQQRIKRERQLEFEAQRQLELEYKKDQAVKEADLTGVPKS